MFSEFHLIGNYLKGVTSSSLNEAKLGRKHMNKEVHIYAPAYKVEEIEKLGEICDHVVFNSSKQIKMYRQQFDNIN